MFCQLLTHVSRGCKLMALYATSGNNLSLTLANTFQCTLNLFACIIGWGGPYILKCQGRCTAGHMPCIYVPPTAQIYEIKYAQRMIGKSTLEHVSCEKWRTWWIVLLHTRETPDCNSTQVEELESQQLLASHWPIKEAKQKIIFFVLIFMSFKSEK